MGISVKKRPKFFPDIAKYADPTAAKRTKPKVKPKKEEDYEIGHKGGGKIMYRSKGGQASGSRRSKSIRKTVGKIKGTPSEKKRDIDSPETSSDRYGTLPIIRPKTGTPKIRVGEPKVPSKDNRGIWNMLENLDASVSYDDAQESYLDVKKKKTKKYGGGKVKYRSIGGKVVDGNEITGMIYN